MNLFKKSVPDLSVLNRLHRKLNPSRFPRMTPVMSAIVGFVLDARFGDHAIGEIMVTCDGVVLARPEGAVKAHIIGSYDDLIRNWQRLLACAGLTKTERIEADSLFTARIGYFFETTT